MTNMEKNIKSKVKLISYRQTSKTTKVSEPEAVYYTSKSLPIVKDFDYKEFKKVADKVPFTQQEWASILHISERTLQRYAKDNSSFNFGVIDRILQIDKVIKRGTEVFGNMDKFIRWLRSNPPALEGRISIEALKTIDGINMVLNQIGRIEHGVLA